MAKFEKVRISLNRPETPPLIEQSGIAEDFRPRRQFLLDIFTSRHVFLRARSQNRLSYLPIEAPNGYVAGFFGRESVIRHRLGPDTAHQQVEKEDWPLSLFILDLTETSQIAWMERNTRVGSPKHVLEDFFLYLLQTTEYNDWRAYIDYLTQEEQYWTAINQYRRAITRLSFTFVPPNALEAHDRVMEFLRIVKRESGPDTTTHTYKSEPGKMNPEGETLKASANIAMEGGGTAEVKAGSKIVYQSRSARITEDIESEEVPTPNEPGLLAQVINKLFGGFR